MTIEKIITGLKNGTLKITEYTAPVLFKDVKYTTLTFFEGAVKATFYNQRELSNVLRACYQISQNHPERVSLNSWAFIKQELVVGRMVAN